jgi:hypothetical protein
MIHLHTKRTLSLIVAMIAMIALAMLVSCGGDDPANPAPPGNTNRAPGTPAINTTAGAPADAATDVALAAVMHWTCSDPDGDDLTYDVYFGTAASPPSVSTDQTAESYTPASLANGIEYYWKVVASDPDGKSTSSPVWSFTTVASASETVSTPSTPAGPTDVTTSFGPNYTTAGAVSSEGHAVEYRFDFDDGVMTAWAASGNAARLWSTAGTYDVKAQARCAADTDVESAWSAALTVTVTDTPPVETVGAPGTPTGLAAVETAVDASYTIAASVSNLGHAVEFQFDWDDGTTSPWDAATTVAHQWAAEGSYHVEAMARCAADTDVESAWSAVLIVTVTDAPPVETISTPDPPVGAATVDVNVWEEYTMTGAVSSEGHALEIQFDWGDGSISSWTTTSSTYRWTVIGDYDVTVYARCQVHRSIESAWSTATTVTVTGAAEIITAPQMRSSIQDFAAVGESVWIIGDGATSNLGHVLENRYDHDDGTISDWGSATQYPIWTVVGTYEIKGQARCSIHTEFESDWSASNYSETIRIYEGAETMLPVELLPPGSIDLDPFFESNYTVKSMSSHGHVYEARIDHGDGNVTDWVSANYPLRPVYFKYTYETSGTFQMVGQARCIDHPSVISEWSVATVVTVSEAVSRPIVTGSATATVGVPATFDVDATNTAGHAIEYELSVSEEHPLVGYVPQPWTTTLPLEYTFPSAGTRYIRVTARCVAHPGVVSVWSNPALTIIVSE